jgi:NADH dehydrogenase
MAAFHSVSAHERDSFDRGAIEQPVSVASLAMIARTKVVVIGAGFGGLNTVRSLRDTDVDITLVDVNNFHLFQPLLYQVATAGLDADDIAYPVRGTLRRQRNARFRLGRVTSVDLAARTVGLHDGATLPYDVLVLSIGAVSASFGVPGVEEHALELKTLLDAERVRAHLLHRFEAASAAGAQQACDLDVVIVGGGPTGVELAGGVRELYDKVLARDFPDIAVRAARITLVEATNRVLGTFAPRLSESAARQLQRRNIDLALGSGVERVVADGVMLADGRQIRGGTVIWAAGVRANPLAAAFGLPIGRGGRVLVQPDLTVEDDPEVFVIGDVAASPDGRDAPLPQVAQVAIQGGRHAARQIQRRLEGLPSQRFHYKDKDSMATIGRNAAVSELPHGITLTGPIGWLAWLGLHLLYLIGFRNRANVLVNWAWNYLTYDRGARLIGDDVNDPPDGR